MRTHASARQLLEKRRASQMAGPGGSRRASLLDKRRASRLSKVGVAEPGLGSQRQHHHHHHHHHGHHNGKHVHKHGHQHHHRPGWAKMKAGLQAEHQLMQQQKTMFA
jgi:hypothetical protein